MLLLCSLRVLLLNPVQAHLGVEKVIDFYYLMYEWETSEQCDQIKSL